tara:strand:- start:575 stop:799 length:225 start_codon:yes stop_codon:yes gene_type:complete
MNKRYRDAQCGGFFRQAEQEVFVDELRQRRGLPAGGVNPGSKQFARPDVPDVERPERAEVGKYTVDEPRGCSNA